MKEVMRWMDLNVMTFLNKYGLKVLKWVINSKISSKILRNLNFLSKEKSENTLKNKKFTYAKKYS